MQETVNYGFKKPEEDDFFNIHDFCDMMDAVDSELKKQHDFTLNAPKSKANLYKRTSVTFKSTGWTGESAPYTNTLSIPGVTATNDIQVIPDASWTVELAEVWSGAMILSGTQSDGALTLKAYGDKPTVDIKVTVMIGDEVEEV